jgi:hypothetical protein
MTTTGIDAKSFISVFVIRSEARDLLSSAPAMLLRAHEKADPSASLRDDNSDLSSVAQLDARPPKLNGTGL